jgi:hypothetical protein
VYLPLYPTRREMGDRKWAIAYIPNVHIDNPTVNMYGAPSTPNYVFFFPIKIIYTMKQLAKNHPCAHRIYNPLPA